MRELKVQCDCGQKYKFDVEPVNNQMPFTVACPICSRDGTEKANMLLRAQAAIAVAPSAAPIPLTMPGAAPAPAPMRVAMPASAPIAPSTAPAPAPMPAGLVPPPPPPGAQPRLRLGATAHVAPMPAETDGAIPPPPPPITPMPGRLPRGAAVEPGGVPRKTSFAMGLVGALIGTAVGSVVYFLLLKFTDVYAIRLVAIGVGALAGWLAEVMGKGEGSNELGVITAVLVLVGVVGAQYFIALGWWHQFSPENLMAQMYAEKVKDAKEVVAAVPTGSESEIRAYLAKQASEYGDKTTADMVPTNEVQEFRDHQLPEYQDLASGKLTEDQFQQKNGIKRERLKEVEDDSEGTFKGVFLILLLSKTSLLSICGAAGLAYKLSTNA